MTRKVTPEAIDSFVARLTRFLCAVDRPGDPEALTGHESLSRDQRGSEYIAAIAEQRPGVEGHGYPAGYPDWDQRFRLWWTGRLGLPDQWWTDVMDDKSIVLPDWMALPLIRFAMQDSELRSIFVGNSEKSDESPSGKIADDKKPEAKDK